MVRMITFHDDCKLIVPQIVHSMIVFDDIFIIKLTVLFEQFMSTNSVLRSKYAYSEVSMTYWVHSTLFSVLGSQ